MFIAIYRWKIKPGMEKQFQESWHTRTETIYRECGSLGSRLHLMEDGTWLAYAQWPGKEKWESVPKNEDDARRKMTECIATDYPALFMTVVDDLLQSSRFGR